MKPEQALWDKMRPIFNEMNLDPDRVENISRSGMPDVNYVHGWVELKHEGAWPVRATTIITIKTFKDKKEQATWLHRRWVKGGLCWVLVRVERRVFLFSGWEAQAIRHGLPRAEFEARAVWSTGADGRVTTLLKVDLLRWLTGDSASMEPHHRARFMRLRCCKTIDQVAEEFGTDPSWVRDVEAGKLPGIHTDDLLAFWEN